MRRFAILLFLLAAPAVAQITNNGDGTSAWLFPNVPNRFVVGVCAHVLPGWITGAVTCDGAYKGKTFVSMGVCAQAEADTDPSTPLPVQGCSAALRAAGACAPSWPDGTVIPHALKCAAVAHWFLRSTGKEAGDPGLAAIEDQLAPAPADTSDDFGD